MADAVESEAPDSVAGRNLPWNRVSGRTRRQRLMERRVGYDYFRYARQQIRYRTDCGEGGRIVQGREHRRLLDCREHLALNYRGLDDGAAAVHDSMDNRVQRVQRIAFQRAHPCDHVAGGGLMGFVPSFALQPNLGPAPVDVAGLGSDALDQTSQVALAASAAIINFDQFELQRRTAAIENQNLHKGPRDSDPAEQASIDCH